MSAARPIPEPVDPKTMDHFVHLRYLKGVVELMSPSRYHETDKKRFARLLEAWSEIAGAPLEGYGSWTLEDEEEDRAAEPDECYMVHRVAKSEPDQTSAVRALRARLAAP